VNSLEPEDFKQENSLVRSSEALHFTANACLKLIKVKMVINMKRKQATNTNEDFKGDINV